jgi:hypothetical protein
LARIAVKSYSPPFHRRRHSSSTSPAATSSASPVERPGLALSTGAQHRLEQAELVDLDPQNDMTVALPLAVCAPLCTIAGRARCIRGCRRSTTAKPPILHWRPMLILPNRTAAAGIKHEDGLNRPHGSGI